MMLLIVVETQKYSLHLVLGTRKLIIRWRKILGYFVAHAWFYLGGGDKQKLIISLTAIGHKFSGSAKIVGSFNNRFHCTSGSTLTDTFLITRFWCLKMARFVFIVLQFRSPSFAETMWR